MPVIYIARHRINIIHRWKPTKDLGFRRWRRNTISRRNHIDLLAAKEDSSFLSALRKLASSSEVQDRIGNDYTDRLHYIEGALGDTGS
ncbi:MAG: hypothetical protein ACFFD3_13715 [Candidatus Thorarchaeota archaeon]